VAVGRFLDGLREGRILGRSCSGCERVLVPPRMFCERCFRPTDAWVEVEATGIVQTYSICHVAWDMRPLDVPELPAVIAIDGSDGGFLHVLGGSTGPGHDGDGRRGRLEARRRARGLDLGHRVLPAEGRV
jgi:uncharacterized OB-fold protein